MKAGWYNEIAKPDSCANCGGFGSDGMGALWYQSATDTFWCWDCKEATVALAQAQVAAMLPRGAR